MPEQLEQAKPSTLTANKERSQDGISTPVIVPPATDIDIVTYLRHSAKFAEIATFAERDALILTNCEKLGITVSDEEWQAAGDAFRQEHKLWGTTETMAWLDQQRISLEDWSEGIRVSLLERKLKEHLFGALVDGGYINNRNRYRRVALSQILAADLATAWKIIHILREGHASFSALALEYSKGKQSQENGGFVGVRFLVELMTEIEQAITNVKEGDIVGPVQTKLGYHVLRVEKWFPTELNESVREQIMNSMFQVWIQNLKNFNQQ
ncbi:peptidylprolyl isomerase [Scytonema hofmannii PCC 7110]|uniref:peptidylprolyl isomerase n=1 Tax=Scytonema hofmannii PCC 7110 TaxID=128403 RepID=A0A139WYX8_9CYAN|nr:peptidylprolyl isomerase [Scytonema hofmannii]KYC37651.1 peptidylprolyl isomerase [Scytonema hofmannii PCC 7110]